MKKDDIIELTIEDLGIDGEGIGKAEIFYCQFDDIVFLHQLLTRLSDI